MFTGSLWLWVEVKVVIHKRKNAIIKERGCFFQEETILSYLLNNSMPVSGWPWQCDQAIPGNIVMILLSPSA
jgi:hypothetical protein